LISPSGSSGTMLGVKMPRRGGEEAMWLGAIKV